MRHAGVLSALLLTAALMCAMPGLMRMPVSDSRVDERLRPAPLRTLTVWLMPGDVGDRKLLSEACAAFEKERDGVRIFLRVVTAEEFTGETAVLPDVALFETGDIAVPEKVFLPLENSHPSGSFAGFSRAVPLWIAPCVLSLPQSWLNQSPTMTGRPDSLLAASTAVPQQETGDLLSVENLPWEQLVQPGAVQPPSGTGWQQLLAACPQALRPQLTAAFTTGSAKPATTPAPKGDSLPRGSGASPTPASAIHEPARVETLSSHQARRKAGEAFTACVFPTAVSDRVRYAALCHDGEDARAFVQFLLSLETEALAHGLIPPQCKITSPDALTQALIAVFQSPVLPNAFAHTRQELNQLCADGFARCEDPVQTLLRLR